MAQTVNLLAEWLIQTGALWVAPHPGWPLPHPAFLTDLCMVTMLVNWKGLFSNSNSNCLLSWFLRLLEVGTELPAHLHLLDSYVGFSN